MVAAQQLIPRLRLSRTSRQIQVPDLDRLNDGIADVAADGGGVLREERPLRRGHTDDLVVLRGEDEREFPSSLCLVGHFVSAWYWSELIQVVQIVHGGVRGEEGTLTRVTERPSSPRRTVLKKVSPVLLVEVVEIFFRVDLAGSGDIFGLGGTRSGFDAGDFT